MAALDRVKKEGGRSSAAGRSSTGRGTSSSRRSCASPRAWKRRRTRRSRRSSTSTRSTRSTRRSRSRTTSRRGCPSAIFTDSMRTAEEFLSHRGSDCGIANVNIGTSGRGDRRRVRRREGNRRRARVRLRFVEGLHAPPDEHDQLGQGPPAGAGREVRPLGKRGRSLFTIEDTTLPDSTDLRRGVARGPTSARSLRRIARSRG